MKKLLTSNWGYKLASVIISAALWFLITNINDPVIPVRFNNITVNLKNASTVTDNGQVYQVLNNTDVIGTVTIYAPRSIADTFSNDNIIASADMDDMTLVGNEYMVPITLTTNKYSNQVQSMTGSVEAVELNIENKASKTLRLTGTTTGTVEDGYVVSDVTVAQNQIRISGPESVVSTVTSAGVKVEVTGYTSNIGTNSEIILYDSDGNEVDDSLISKNIDTVGVNVTILATKYVGLDFTVSGVPATGYMTTGEIEYTPDTVLIAGKTGVLNSIENISIEDASLDVTDATSDITASIDVSKYLPTGTLLGDSDFNGIVSVVVHISPIYEKELTIPANQIALENVPEGYTAKLSNTSGIAIVVRGLEDTVSETEAADITGTVDINDIIDSLDTDSDTETDTATEAESVDETADYSGNYEAVLTLALPGGITVSDKVNVNVVLTKEVE